MNRFALNAMRILEAAEAAAAGGQTTAMTVLVSGTGGIRLVADSDWSLESLRQHHAADEAYRVVHDHGRIRLEGAGPARRCVMESENPALLARMLLDRPVDYRAAGAQYPFA